MSAAPKSQQPDDLSPYLAIIYEHVSNTARSEEVKDVAFTQYAMEQLEEAGVTNSALAVTFENDGARVDGFAFDIEEGFIDLFVAIYNDSEEVTPLSAEEAEIAISKAIAFKDALREDSLMEEIPTGSAISEMAEIVKEALTANQKLRVFLVTNLHLESQPDNASFEEGIQFQIWDLERLNSLREDGSISEPINIDFQDEFGNTLPCLAGAEGAAESEMTVYLLAIPGTILAKLYDEYTGRLLERNVRSFLQFRGKINKGIRETILKQPEKFFAYNNGISATASEATIRETGEGTADLLSVKDFQIVNGGQTTASIYTCWKKDEADHSKIRVQTKLTVVTPDIISEVVPLISKFANTQNRILQADFSANHPYHEAIETLSREIKTPDSAGGKANTSWYYERYHGSYQNEIAQLDTKKLRQEFKKNNPPKQKFTKTDLGKYEMTWRQLPHIVCLGAQKCFVQFMELLAKEQKSTPNANYFQRLIAKAILFKRCDELYAELEFQGYKARVVTHSLAYLYHHTANQIPLDEIWETQRVPEKYEEALRTIIPLANEAVTKPPKGWNSNEYCKKTDCWERVTEIDSSSLSAGLSAPLTTKRGKKRSPSPDQDDLLSEDQLSLIDTVNSVPAEIWYDIASWAADTDNLQVWQRKISFSLGGIAAQPAKKPSIKQSIQGRKLLLAAVDLGYKNDALTDEMKKNQKEAPDCKPPK